MENKHPMNQRRMRANIHIRELASTVVLDYKKFIQPLFVNQTLTERKDCLLYTSPSPRDRTRSRMPSSA